MRRIRNSWHRAPLRQVVGLQSYDLERLIQSIPDQYSTFYRNKRGGGERMIRNPSHRLRQAQTGIKAMLYDAYRMPSCVCAYVPRRTLLDAAAPHVGQELLIWLDIKDFYPSISACTVKTCFLALGFGEAESDVLAALTTLDNELPQGALTSPFLSNLAACSIDRRISRIAKRAGGTYTRYGDDLFVSGCCELKQLRGPLREAIVNCGFTPSDKRPEDELQYRNRQQCICGLVVNDRVRPTMVYSDKVGDAILACQRNDFVTASIDLGVPLTSLKQSLNGMVSYIGQYDKTQAHRFKWRMRSVDWPL